MKKLLLIAAIFGATFNVKAQLLTNLLSDSIVVSTFDLNSFIEQKTYLINTHSDTIIADFEVFNIDNIPENWSTTAFCFTSIPPVPGNVDICLDLFVGGSIPGQFRIAPGDSIELKIQVEGGGNPGQVVLNTDLMIEDKNFIESEIQELLIVLDLKSDNVSINSIEKNSFNIYPNPAQNNINIKGLDRLSNNATVEIYSIIGVKVAEIEYKNRSIDISNLQKGVYLLKVSDTDKTYSQTFVKQ